MPQKLIRLTCESNDGVFDGLFDQDIHIKQDSEIAFQSLTLERAASSFSVNDANDNMAFVSRDDGAVVQQGFIRPRKTYQKADRFELLQNITKSLNKPCDFTVRPRQMNTQWQAKVNEDKDKVEIACRPSPFFPMAIFDTTAGAPLYNTFLVRDAPVNNGVANAETPDMGAAGMGRLTESATRLLNESYIYMPSPFIKSTGSLRVRLGTLTQGTLNAPAFTIALVDTGGLLKLNDGTIELTDLEYAVVIDQASADPAQGGYKFINQKGTATQPSNPFIKIEASTGAVEDNDVIEIVMRGGYLQGLIHQDTAGLKELPRSTRNYAEVDGEQADLFPVIFFHLANTDGAPTPPLPANQKAVLDIMQCSLDPWKYADWYQLMVTPNPQIQNKVITQTSDTVVFYDRPAGNAGDTVVAHNFDPFFEFEADDIARYLGYSEASLYDGGERGAELITPPDLTLTDPITGNPYTRQQGYQLLAKDVFDPGVDSDSYLVDTQTFMLDSYDSYGLSASERNANAGGSRRNLLATIPVAEIPIPNSVNARVVYEPNTLDYIAIKNRSDIITRQLRMRLLDARYEPISTAGLAAMTILIRDPYRD